MKNKKVGIFTIIIIIAYLLIPSISIAHPGRTDSRGGHVCRTNCDKWGVPWNEWHSHGGGSSSSSSGSSSSSSKSTPAPAKPKITYKNITKTEKVAFETKYEDDESIEEGQTEVKQEGANGVKTITYKVTYKDGKETSRVKVSEEVTTKPVDEIILNGTKPKEEEVKKEEPVKEVAQEEETTEELPEVSAVEAIIGLGVFAVGLGLLGYGIFWFIKKSKEINKK